jgi:phospholipid-binding lipoprotein MlaA
MRDLYNYLKSMVLVALLVSTTNVMSNTIYTPEVYKYNYSLDDAVEDECSDLDDPFEKYNRKIFAFNSFLDHFFLKPIAKGYKALFNSYTRDKVGNFVDNFNVPLTTVNNILQLEGKEALVSFWQFAINTTLGVGGLYDVAGPEGVKTLPQTFGSTLARYGVGPGPYIIIPFFSGSSVRDMLDVPILNSAMNPLKYVVHSDFRDGMLLTSLIQKRSELLSFTDYVEKNSTDPYTVIRSSIHQHREKDLRYPTSYRCKRIYLK